MKGLKDFRRSLNKERTSGGRPGAAAPAQFMGVKNAVSIQPPKMVIRATRDYRSRAPQELSFSKGDFFHVLTEDNPNPDWLEATNPATNARGLVPTSYFDILHKQGRPGAGGAGIPVIPLSGGAGTAAAAAAAGVGAAAAGSEPMTSAEASSGLMKQNGGYYAVVKFDFAAERADELEAAAGEPIIVIAQSNYEWFVAKPIGRLGGPGLIPVTFVELKNVVTGQKVDNVDDLIAQGVIPKVEEWKKQTADYKKNTISLGRLDFAPQSAPQPGNYDLDPSGASGSPQVPPKDGPFGMPSAGMNMDSGYANAAAANQLELPPGMPPGEPLPTGIVTSAQVDSFHFEQGDYWFRIQATHIAGHSPTAPPTAPTAPAGEERVLILYRLYEDFYEFQIALLDHFPAEAGRDTLPNGQQSERILPLMPGPLEHVDDYVTSGRKQELDTYINELCALPEYITRSELVRLFFEPRPGDHCTVQPLPNGSDAGGAHSGAESRSSMPMGATHLASYGESNGTAKYAEDAPVGANAASRSVEELGSKLGTLGVSGKDTAGGSQNFAGTEDRSSGPANVAATRKPTTDSFDSRGSSMHAGVSGGTTTPATPSPAFMKIKIFNKATDDLVAIRVPPNVTYVSLMEKVRERLGAEVAVLRYREPEAGPNVMMRLSDDDDLQDFLATGDKLQLFADVK